MPSVVFFNVSHNIGGAELSLLELCRYLKADELAVICPEGSILEARIKQEHVKTGPIKVPVLRGGSGLFSKLTNYTYARRTRQELDRILARQSYDVFVTNNLIADFFAGNVPRKYCKKTVCYCRDNPENDVKARFIDSRDLLIAPSGWIGAQLTKLGIAQQARINNGLDVGYFKSVPTRKASREALNLPEDWTMIGYACQFIRRKGLLEFIDCAEQLAEERHDLMFVIAGGDLYEGSPFVQEVKTRIATSPARARIKLIGYLEDMRPFYAASDLYVSLSRDEPFGRTPLEAALCGTIPIASREGGYMETMGDFPELLVNPEDRGKVCDCINEFLSPRGDKDKILADIRARASSFSIETTARKLEEAWSGLLED